MHCCLLQHLVNGCGWRDKKLGNECGMATVEGRKPPFGDQTWWEEGTIHYKKLIRVNRQDADKLSPC